MILTDPNLVFQSHGFFEVEYLKNGQISVTDKVTIGH